MSSSLSVTRSLTSENKIKLVFEILPNGTLPRDIFTYENTGTLTLGEYQGVCSMDELANYQVWVTGNVINKFGNRYVRFSQGVLEIDSDLDPSIFINKVKKEVANLSNALSTLANPYTEIFPIL